MHSSIILLTLLVIVASAQPHEPGLHYGDLMDVLTIRQRRELSVILHDNNKPRAEIKQAIKDWVAKQDDKIKQAFEKVQKNNEEYKKEREEMRAKRIANLSSEAKAVEEQVHAIFEDDNLSRKQTCEKVNEIVSKASNAIKTELRLRVHDCDMPPNMPQNPLNNRRG